MLVLDVYCPALNLETKLCKNYTGRLGAVGDIVECQKIEERIKVGSAPVLCGYVAKNYRSKLVIDDWRKYMSMEEHEIIRARVDDYRRNNE